MSEATETDPFVAIHYNKSGPPLTKQKLRQDKDGASVWTEADLVRSSGERMRIRTPHPEILKRWRKEHVPLHTRVKGKISRILSEPKVRKIRRMSLDYEHKNEREFT